jgi:hypothetical protein
LGAAAGACASAVPPIAMSATVANPEIRVMFIAFLPFDCSARSEPAGRTMLCGMIVKVGTIANRACTLT